MLTTLIILNIILAVLTVIFIVKELLINFKESKSKIKTSCLFIFVIISLFFAFVAGSGGFFISQQRDMLENELLTVDKLGYAGESPQKREDIEEELKNLKRDENALIIYTSVGYLSFGCLLLINKNILKEMKAIKSNGKWDLDKF